MEKKTLFSCLAALLLFCTNVNASEAFDEQGTYLQVFNALSRNMDENGNSDLARLGDSDFIRMLTCLNELSTDEAHCCWEDSGLPDLNNNTWTSTLPQAETMFARLQLVIYHCNRYLENADVSLVQRRAEIRFVRALMYSYLIDLYGDVPFTTSSSEHNLAWTQYDEYEMDGNEMTLLTKRPAQRSRSEVFQYIEEELNNVMESLPAPDCSQKYRPDQAAVWLLLSRLYLNAEVYTGTPRWAEAKQMAMRLLENDVYRLADEYKKLFMADNDVNGAEREIVFAIRQDGADIPTWNGTTYLTAACYDSNMPYNGMTQHWAGIRARRQLVEKFNPNDGDNRYLFCNYYNLDIDDPTNFWNGYGIMKYTNLRYDGTQASSVTYADTDFPLLRKAEAYLIFAEADARMNGGTCSEEGLSWLNVLRQRANAPALSTATLVTLADEWAREFYLEGRRRTDLIRFGLYSGDTYVWQWKGGTKDGQSIEAYRCLFPLTDYFMSQRDDYVQNEGYADINKVIVSETFTLDTPAFANTTVSLNEATAMAFTWQRPEISDPYGYQVRYQLQFSPSGNFGNPIAPTDYVNWGVGNTTYVQMASATDFYQAEVSTSEIDGILLSWKGVRRWSDRPQVPIDIYFRCVATLATKQSVSNVVKVTVMPYCNNINSTDYYLVGEGIGDGQQTLNADGIGTSMLPLDINTDDYVCGWGRIGGGTYQLTTWLEQGKRFYLRQMVGQTVITTDGTADGATFSYNYNSSPVPNQQFSVDESGWYTIRFKPNPSGTWTGTDWVYDKMMTIEKVAEPSGNTSTVSCDSPGGASIALQTVAGTHNRLWRGMVSVKPSDDLSFTIDGKSFGGKGFSFGYIEEGGTAIDIPEGTYIVTLNTVTGFYDFYDIDDTEFLKAPLSPREYMYKQNLQPKRNEDFVVTGAEDIDTNDEWVKVCEIDDLPTGMSLDGLHLVIGNYDMEMDTQCRVRSSQLIKAINLTKEPQPANMPRNFAARMTSTAEGITANAYIYGLCYTDGLATLESSNTFSITVLFANYYLVGGFNGWDLGNSSYPLTTTDGVVYSINVGRNDLQVNGGNFLLVPQTAHDNYDWDAVYRLYYAIDDYTGYFATDSEGGWGNLQLPEQPSDYDHYHLVFDFNDKSYIFTPILGKPTSIAQHPSPSNEDNVVYDLQGRRISPLAPHLSPLKKVVYVRNGKKFIQK